jgi:hypothetical protein
MYFFLSNLGWHLLDLHHGPKDDCKYPNTE